MMKRASLSVARHSMFIVFSGFCAGATAQSATDDSLTDTGLVQSAIHATRLDYSEFEVPEAVTVITQEDIRLAGYIKVSEIFRSVPGFRIVKIGDESRISYHGTAVRQNRRMLVTVDGRSILIGDGQYVEFDRLPISLADVARVTITRGPDGAAYGDNAFLCSIDFKTIGRNDPRGISFRGGGGYNGRSKAEFSANKGIGGYDFLLAAGAEHDGGYDYQDRAGTPRNDGKDIKRVQMILERDFTERSHWRLDTNYYDAENKTGIQTLAFTGDQRNDGKFIALSNRRELREASRLDWIISHNRQRESIRESGCYTPQAVAIAVANLPDPALRAQFLAPTAFLPALLGVPLQDVCLYTDVNIQSQRSEAELQFESRRGPWRYLLGASATQIDAQSDQYFASLDQDQRSYRAFGETSLSVGKLHASLGAMAQDSNNVESTELAWRGALNWQFLPNQMLRYSYASSFRIPSLVETETFWTSAYFFGRRGAPLSTYLFSITSPLVTNSVQIKPETIQSHAIGYFGTFLRSSATVDIKLFSDQITDPVQSNVFYFSPPPFNSGPYTLRGAETELAFRLSDQWRVSGQYSYLDSSARSTFERGLQGYHADSVSVSYRPIPAHAFTVSYYGNSVISGNTYDRYDLVYNYSRTFGSRLFRSQLIFNHYVGGADGIRDASGADINEGYFADLNQFVLNMELNF